MSVATHSHKFNVARHKGFKSFEVCQLCGCAKHSSLYWFAGWKSKQEPPCNPTGSIDDGWLQNASPVDYDQLN